MSTMQSPAKSVKSTDARNSKSDSKSAIMSPGGKSLGGKSSGTATFEMNVIKEQILTQNKIRREREQKIEARKMADIIREYVDQAKEAKKMEEIRKSLQSKRKQLDAERRKSVLQKRQIEQNKKIKFEEERKRKRVKIRTTFVLKK